VQSLNSQSFINRRTFLKKGLKFIWIPFLVGLGKMVHDQKKQHNKSKQIAKESIYEGINFFNEVILIKSLQSISAFEAKCTHLGCQLKESDKGLIKCSCHGSAFNQNGEAVKGPAYKSLKHLNIRFIASLNIYEIELP
jgi:Rieske Fe-S protein